MTDLDEQATETAVRAAVDASGYQPDDPYYGYGTAFWRNIVNAGVAAYLDARGPDSADADLHNALLEINSDWSDWGEADALKRVLQIAADALRGRPEWPLVAGSSTPEQAAKTHEYAMPANFGLRNLLEQGRCELRQHYHGGESELLEHMESWFEDLERALRDEQVSTPEQRDPREGVTDDEVAGAMRITRVGQECRAQCGLCTWDGPWRREPESATRDAHAHECFALRSDAAQVSTPEQPNAELLRLRDAAKRLHAATKDAVVQDGAMIELIGARHAVEVALFAAVSPEPVSTPEQLEVETAVLERMKPGERWCSKDGGMYPVRILSQRGERVRFERLGPSVVADKEVSCNRRQFLAAYQPDMRAAEQVSAPASREQATQRFIEGGGLTLYSPRAAYEAGFDDGVESVSAPASRERTVWTCMSCGHITESQSCDACGREAMPGRWVEVSALAEPTEAMIEAGLVAERAEGCWSSVDVRGVVTSIIRAALSESPLTGERQLLECEEALRSTQEEYAEFRERMLAPIKGTEGESIESMSWDDLLGIAVRNIKMGLAMDRALRRIQGLAREPFSAVRLSKINAETVAALSESPWEPQETERNPAPCVDCERNQIESHRELLAWVREHHSNYEDEDLDLAVRNSIDSLAAAEATEEPT
jgi:hypothetical protein